MIDTFHRIRTLFDLGVKIHLHSFAYGRVHSPEIGSFCQSVKYYDRKNGFLRQFSLLPYIVTTRKSQALMQNLCENDYPILFDGIHTTGILSDPSLSARKKIVRVHNIEHNYYKTLASNETGIFRKLYYLAESERLKRYENILSQADHLLSVSPSDNEYFNKMYHNSVLMPSSHPFDKTEILRGSGNYIIYHGDLSVNENFVLAGLLAEKVFPFTNCICIIAGKNPPRTLINKASLHSNIRLVANPGTSEMSVLIREAHINILPVIKMNGLKLKLLFALHAGRHLIVNTEMAKGLEPGGQYTVANSADEMISSILQLLKQPFTDEMIRNRTAYLSDNFSNIKNTNKLVNLI
jgi:hypothetical protein